MAAHIDFETFSESDLRKVGSYVYAQHPSTDVLCLCYAIDDGPVQLWIPGDEASTELLAHIVEGGNVIGHNVAGFEHLIWNHVMGLKYGWPALQLEQLQCTMAMAYATGLPGTLEMASKAAGLDVEKDMKGHRIMLQLCKPRRALPSGGFSRWTPEEYPEKYQTLYDYCRQDVVVERELCSRLMKLSTEEQETWILDAKINKRGVGVDRKLAAKALEAVEFEKARLNKQISEVTEGVVSTGTATGQLTDWLKWKGLEVPSVAKADVLEMLDQDIPDECRKALLIRQQVSKTSTSKLVAMEMGCNSDDRMRGLFQYHGATTGRWAGRRVQLQNLKRPSMSLAEIEEAFVLIEHAEPEEAGKLIASRFGSPMDVIGDMVRGFLVPGKGRDFITCDFSAIEARVLAWLAGEENILRIFKGDGKLYEHAAAVIYRLPVDAVTKEQRQVGKVAELALGYGGGVNAFQTMARGYGVTISDEKAQEIKNVWRQARPQTVKFWRDLEGAAMEAIKSPGDTIRVGGPGVNVRFVKQGSFLWCSLPSGRVICYPYPEIQEAETPWGERRNVTSYMNVNSFTHKWERTRTYGGKLCENVTQAVARCVLRDSMFRLEDSGYPIVAHVHDEVVTEVPIGFGSLKEVESIMSAPPAWATDMPVDAEGWRGNRYRK